MKTLISSVQFPSPAAARALAKLQLRLDAMERLDSAQYRNKVRQLFGKVLTPEAVVARILSDVKTKGNTALFDYAKRLDDVTLTQKNLLISKAERRAAFQRTPPALREALELATDRIRDYQRRLLPGNIPLAAASGGPPGVLTGLSWSALQRVGVYVPGGTAAYPSSVLMNVIPAQIAGVSEIAVATPCDKNGAVSDGVLCACEILKIDEIYRIGGAQAIGALAYGTHSIPRVDKIVGPGNLFVMLAKRAVFGRVDIDMLAGPSEILIIADDSANPVFVAADLLAQAEHDVLASCVLVTTSAKLAAAVEKELARQLSDLPRAAIATAALRDWGLMVVTRDLKSAVTVANNFAPEHLEIITKNPKTLVPQLTTAGAIFIGPYATETLGDYLAGPSHTLPTAATARAFSGLSVYSFLRRTSLIEANRHGLEELTEPLSILAAAEGLEAHRRAVVLRTL